MLGRRGLPGRGAGHHGSTHFLEHLLFKGTARRSAMDIASAFDAVGGEANAVTGKEHTCYYARVLDEDVDLAVRRPARHGDPARLDGGDVESERGVILEELAMNDDDPADVVHERFAELVLSPHPLGRPIGGTAETIAAVGRDDIAAHYREHYTPPGWSSPPRAAWTTTPSWTASAGTWRAPDGRCTDGAVPLPRRELATGTRSPAPAACSSSGGRPNRPTSSSAPSG